MAKADDIQDPKMASRHIIQQTQSRTKPSGGSTLPQVTTLPVKIRPQVTSRSYSAPALGRIKERNQEVDYSSSSDGEDDEDEGDDDEEVEKEKGKEKIGIYVINSQGEETPERAELRRSVVPVTESSVLKIQNRKVLKLLAKSTVVRRLSQKGKKGKRDRKEKGAKKGESREEETRGGSLDDQTRVSFWGFLFGENLKEV